MIEPHKSLHVLLAGSPQGAAWLRPVLAEFAEVTLVHSVEEAIRTLADGPDLAVCNMKFDDSRMLELALEAHRCCPGVPFLACRASESELPEGSFRAMQAALANVGANFFDFYGACEELGLEGARERFRIVVLQLVRCGKASPLGLRAGTSPRH